jgi:ribokinase
LVDVIAIGAINWDVNLWVDDFPNVGEEVSVRKISRVPGGKAANVAVAAARMIGKNRVFLFGALGKDEIGRKQVETLRREGVDTSLVKFVEDVESGQAYITIDKNGSNSIETLFGANHEFLPDDLLERSRLSTIEKCKVVAISDPIIPTAEKIAALGAGYGARILYDPGTKIQAGLGRLKSVLRHTSILIVNSVESNRLAGSTDPSKVRMKLREHDLDLDVVVKLGEKGSAYAGKENRTQMMPSFPLEEFGLRAASTVGCGDAFLGVLAASLSQGFSEVESIRRANLAGGLKATKAETQGSPDQNELEKFLEIWRRKQ